MVQPRGRKASLTFLSWDSASRKGVPSEVSTPRPATEIRFRAGQHFLGRAGFYNSRRMPDFWRSGAIPGAHRRFGSKWSEVQILSPKPVLSVTCERIFRSILMRVRSDGPSSIPLRFAAVALCSLESLLRRNPLCQRPAFIDLFPSAFLP
jgi:hypothetical protein